MAAKKSVLRTVTYIMLWVFGGCAAYSALAIAFPVLAIFGGFLGIGLLANLTLVPAGIVLLFCAGAHLLRERAKKRVGLGLILTGAALLAFAGYQTWAGRQAIESRALQIAALPVQRFEVDKGATVVHLNLTSNARCHRNCALALLTGDIGAYVQGYQSKSRLVTDPIAASRYREFRLGREDQCNPVSVGAGRKRGLEILALVRVAGLCILERDLGEPPDGLWIIGFHAVHNRPDFEFDGQIFEIRLRRGGDDRLLIHHEAGSGAYPAFPPLFLSWFSSETPRVHHDRVSFKLEYGTWTTIEVLAERVAGLSLRENYSLVDLLPVLMQAARTFERNYERFTTAERIEILTSIKAVLRERPERFAELEPLVLRAAEDAGVAGVAVRILAANAMANREVYVPVILSAADDPASHVSVVAALLEIDTGLSSADLLHIVDTRPDPTSKSSSGDFNLFKLLDRHGQRSEAALLNLLQRADASLNDKAADRLIKLGRQDLVRDRADVFEQRLEAYRPKRNNVTRSYGNAPHQILARIGLRDTAASILEAKLQDPALTDAGRRQLELMLDELTP